MRQAAVSPASTARAAACARSAVGDRGQRRAQQRLARTAEAGEPGLFPATADAPGQPDSADFDAEVCVWMARFGDGCLVRITPQGQVDTTIPLPVTGATCCAFGGSGLDTLFVTSATALLPPDELARQLLASALFAPRPGCRGLPERTLNPTRSEHRLNAPRRTP